MLLLGEREGFDLEGGAGLLDGDGLGRDGFDALTAVVNIGDTIKRRRAELGMSQADLAKASDINLRQVRRYESDEQQPAIGVAVRLARALGVTIGGSPA